MATLEPVEDPYLALGVTKDADISAIRSAHRKLVLKFHPDRIKDEAERIRGKDLFQKVQQAYELLSDPVERARYDDKVKLAQLRKEAAARESPIRMPAAYSTQPPPPSTPSREYRDGRFYEERVPTASFFDEGYRYHDEEQRTTSRKYDGYERKTSASFVEKEKKPTKWPEKTSNGLPFDISIKLKAKAAKARDTVGQKTRERETFASTAKSRDREQKRERVDKQSRRAYVEDDSSSDSDTVVNSTVNRGTSRASKSYESPPPPKAKPGLTRSKTSVRYEDDDEDDRPASKSKPGLTRSKTSVRYDEPQEDSDKWQGYHGHARDYIERSQRPGVYRAGSTASYWEPADERPSGKRSGSDSDRRPYSSKGRRESVEVPKSRPPPMPSHSSAPAGVAEMKASLGKDPSRPQRSSTGSTSPRTQQKEMPSMSRSQTMPNTKSTRSRGDAAPAKGSNLKHAETHDSGYGSSGGHTPELNGTSPPKYFSTSTRYQIVDDEDDDDVSTILVDNEDRHRRRRSPSPPPRERERERDRDRDRDRRERPQRPTVTTDSRSKTSRGSSYAQSPGDRDSVRPTPRRQESVRVSPREAPTRELPERQHSGRGKLFNEIDERDQAAYTVRYPGPLNTSPRIEKQDVKYAQYGRGSSDDSPRDRDRDYVPYSRHRDTLHSPRLNLRPGSVN